MCGTIVGGICWLEVIIMWKQSDDVRQKRKY